jgi:exopolyphosphatase/guanosine-5'-triphosphate,3'-diphosphate pyrophosphatase
VPRQAAIDIGTNSVRLLVAEVADAASAAHSSPRAHSPDSVPFQASPSYPRLTPVVRRMAMTRLGEGLEAGGMIDAAAAARTAAAVREFVAFAAAAGAPHVEIVGTYALRVARNPEELLRRLDHPVRVLSGAEEARLGFHGALGGLGIVRTGARTLVVDIGGGSVEFALGTPQDIEETHSVPLGAVVLTRRFLPHDPPRALDVAGLRALLTETLDPLLTRLSHPRSLLAGVGGTITSLAALDQRLDPYDPDRVHGYRLRTSAVRAITADLLAQPLADRRRRPGLQPERADIICAGALVLEHVLVTLSRRSVMVSEADLLWALVLLA